MKKISLFLAIILVLTTLTGCEKGYDYEWMLGKNHEEIVARYGEFDGYINGGGEDSIYNKNIIDECKNSQFSCCVGYYVLNSSNENNSSIQKEEIRLRIDFYENRVMCCYVSKWQPKEEK